MTGYRCGACKFQRKKCPDDCPFAPFFKEEDGLDDFHTIHKVFGSKNFNRFMSELSPNDHEGLILSLLYEARTRLNDPILGCVRQILDLQKQVEALQAQVAHLQGPQTAHNLVINPDVHAHSTSAATIEGLSASVAHLRELQATHGYIISPHMNAGSSSFTATSEGLPTQVAHLRDLQATHGYQMNVGSTSSAAMTEGLPAPVATQLININIGASSASAADDMMNQDDITSLVPQSSAPCDDNVFSLIRDIELDDDFMQWFFSE